jgi:hypothetical protein
MSNLESTAETPGEVTREEALAALFASMVIQQTNLALMLLGRLPHPETGQTVHDLEGARLMIDQLEMLEVKTQGNLSEPESRLVQQNLTALRMAFVEAVEKGPGAAAAPPPAAADPVSGRPTLSPLGPGAPPPDSEVESKKKFSKKY